MRQKRVMDQFAVKDELYPFELKRMAGFGKGGEDMLEFGPGDQLAGDFEGHKFLGFIAVEIV